MPAPATASTATPSNWWYEGYGVAEVHAEGWTGAGVKVAVIDNQILPDAEVLQGADITIDPEPVCGGNLVVVPDEPTDGAVHGVEVTAMLVGNGTGPGEVRGIVPDAEVLFYGLGMDKSGSDEGLSGFGAGIRRALDDGAQVISISQGWEEHQMIDEDADQVARAIASGVPIVTSTPNSMLHLFFKWPWNLNGVVSVAGFAESGVLMGDAETDGRSVVAHPEVTVIAPAEVFRSATDGKGIGGSSLAAPLVAGILAANAQKYPDATGSQLIQSLIHNTGVEDHELQRDETGGTGYGWASLRHTLAVDPSQYPDENPLMDKASGIPTVEQVEQAANGTVEPTAEPNGEPSAETWGAIGVTAAVIGAILLLLIIIAVVIIIVVVTRRSARKASGGAP